MTIKLLGLRNRTQFVSPYISSPCFKKMVEDGLVTSWTGNSDQWNLATAVFDWGLGATDPKIVSAGSLTADLSALGVSSTKSIGVDQFREQNGSSGLLPFSVRTRKIALNFI